MAANSNRRKAGGKPKRVRKDLQVWLHSGSQRWAKKVRGRTVYFSPIKDDPYGEHSEAEYLRIKADLLAGREPTRNSDLVTVADVANAFLTHKNDLVKSNELTIGSFNEYKRDLEIIIDHFGAKTAVASLRGEDFGSLRSRFSRNSGPTRLGKQIQTTRSLFKFGYDNELLEKPVRFGTAFKRPSRATLRRHRAAKGERLLTAKQIHKLTGEASPAMKAFIYLAVNAGLGNSDCAKLEFGHLDMTLKDGWAVMSYPRPKTGIPRRAFLWPETREAIETAIEKRPQPKDKKHDHRVFITKYGQPWISDTSTDNALAKEFAKLLTLCEIKGQSFYALRHTHRTVSDETGDFPACDLIMGHVRDDMASTYRERVSDERLRTVAEYVRNWLYKDVSKDPVDGDDESTDDESQIQSDDENTKETTDDDRPQLRIYVG